MMTRAYNAIYVSDARKILANAFDYALNDCKIDIDDFAYLFSSSFYGNEFEIGNPYIISGMSGVDLARNIINDIYSNKVLPKPSFSFERSPYYWAGWALAYYQWYTNKRFKEIFKRIPLKEIIAMYNIYHEMDIMNFVEEMDNRYDSINFEPKLKTLRKAKNLSQSELSRNSGVAIRSIQLYEEGVNNIDKAQAHTLYKLSRALGCTIEDILEKPEKCY